MSKTNKFSRLDYIQVGLTSKNTFRSLHKADGQEPADIVIGDHAGSVHSFSLRTDSNQIETIFKTLPGPNSKINCVEVLNENTNAYRILVATGPSTIKGYNKKGKQFFALELNNLTEPIRIFKVRWPEEIFVVGQFIYNSYMINNNNESSSGGNKVANSVVKSRHYYVCPEKVNDFLLLEDKLNRRTIPVLACQDRLLRVLRDSTCSFEVEVCGIPSTMQVLPAHLVVDQSPPTDTAQAMEEVHICYGTLDGKISLVTFQFLDKTQLEPVHKWEVPLNSIKQPINCLVFSQLNTEFYVGRTDGSLEYWKLNETIDNENVQSVDISIAPSMLSEYNCGESVTNMIPLSTTDRLDTFLLCSTFTGMIFGLSQRSEAQSRQLNPNYLIISQENATRIEGLKSECEKLERKLIFERDKYEKLASNQNLNEDMSALPFFSINDSFVLHNDASYVLMLEVEVSIDVVVMHCDILLDLIDCERNSAVISYNDPTPEQPNQVLVTFRCQANTTRLEIRIRPVEGQHGTLSVYILSRITPKSCQTRSYAIQPLSLHKRQYSNTQIDYPNTLTIDGDFSMNDTHTWLRLCIPEVPEKLNMTISEVESEVFYYISTMTRSILVCNCGQGKISFSSDNVSTISILKDFMTREATRQSIPIEMRVDIMEPSIAVILRHLFPKVRKLVLERQRHELYEAVSDLQSNETDITAQLFKDLRLLETSSGGGGGEDGQRDKEGEPKEDVQMSIDRLYGIITDLFIDYHKLKGSSMTGVLRKAKEKLPDMVEIIEASILDSVDYLQRNKINKHSGDDDDEDQEDDDVVLEPSNTGRANEDVFVEQLYQFWDVPL